MERKSHRRSLTTKVGLLYFFMNVISISLFTWVITNNQVELITDNTRYQAKELMATVVQDLRKLPSVSAGKREHVLEDLNSSLSRILPNYVIFRGDSILYSVPQSMILPPDHAAAALRATMLYEQTGVDYHLVISDKNEQLGFYVPLKSIGADSVAIYTTLSLDQVGRRFRDLYQLIIVTVLALTLLHFAFGVLIFRMIITPILKLQDATRRVAEGDYEYKVDQSRPDELGALAEGFNYMVDMIQKTIDRIGKMAVTDELTGLYNRRHFFEQAEHVLDTALRHKRPLSLALLDVDHFKKVNDTHGHLVGDQVLRKIGALLIEMGRKSDVLARYGGEELILLMPETDREGALRAAEKLRAAVESLEIPMESGGLLKVTTSVGVALYSPSITVQQFIEAADVALYQAKHSGRNRVVLSESGLP